MVARKTKKEEDPRMPGSAKKREAERRRNRVTERAPRQPRLSYADCSEQLDFNVGINPLPLNFIHEE